MKNIQHKLTKYQASYVPGEKRSKEYDNMIRQNNTLADNIHLLHQLNQELPETLQVNRCDIKLIETLLVRFKNNLNTLHRQSKTEAIILAFLFYINKMSNPRIQIENYTIFRKYGLTTPIYTVIITRVCDNYIRERPIPIITTTNYDHDKLIRNGGI